ncbi:MAG: phosphoribosylaminoimidazolecarboxamide formyltransferase [Oscillospiraceae bacterium]|jgi:AICAR transformylase/IMP cyclohydrolase PurH|nr:phosphoribosylaminoimidazolecarboxamide formyltransferase [Oscillospiraceae bacterium]
MTEFLLKYGCNPNQSPSRIFMEDGAALPVEVRNGRPGYINFLDALNSWQLVRELKAAIGLPAAASFKHVSPAGAAVGLPLHGALRQIYRVAGDLPLSPLACAYARARGSDRMSSFGDWIALSDPCDLATALLIQHEVSDGVIAPGYAPEALAILSAKRKGSYAVVQIDPAYRPAPLERKQVFGVTFEQGRNEIAITAALLENVPTKTAKIPAEAVRDLLLSLITLKYTQSNSVCYAADGQTIGVGAGQQSRIHCTRLAGEKADVWRLRQHPKTLALPLRSDLPRAVADTAIDLYVSGNEADVLGEAVWREYFDVRPEGLSAAEKADWLAAADGVALGSDAFFPFGDNVERAARSGVRYIAQPGGSVRDDQVIAAADRLGIAMAFTGARLFHH